MRRILSILTLLMVFPWAAQTAPPQAIERFLESRQVVGQVFFAYQASALTAVARQHLDELAAKLDNHRQQGRLVRIEGFASTDGLPRHNSRLSVQRALAVKDYLLDRHRLQIDVFLTGFGEKHATDGRLASERRVDIAVYELTPGAKTLFEDTGQIERYPLQ